MPSVSVTSRQSPRSVTVSTDPVCRTSRPSSRAVGSRRAARRDPVPRGLPGPGVLARNSRAVGLGQAAPQLTARWRRGNCAREVQTVARSSISAGRVSSQTCSGSWSVAYSSTRRLRHQEVWVFHQDAPDVSVQRAFVLDAVPGQVGLGQRGLQKVLGVGAVPGQQIGDAQECAGPFGDIAREPFVSVRRHATVMPRGCRDDNRGAARHGADLDVVGRPQKSLLLLSRCPTAGLQY